MVPEAFGVAAMGIVINVKASHNIQITILSHSKLIPFGSNLSTWFLILLA
jgi:hypothetical protein